MKINPNEKHKDYVENEIANLLAKDEHLSYIEAKSLIESSQCKNKAKFFAIYFDQMVYTIDYNNKPIIYRNFGNRADEQVKGLCKEAYLLLTPLSQITDEDAIEVASIFGWNSYSDESKIHQVKEFLFNKLDYHTTNISANEYFQLLGFLRSRGYYVGDGTEIEYGWVKLKEA